MRQAIEQKEKIAASRCEVNTENVLREASALAFSDIRKLFNTDGSPKSMHELDDATAAAIKSIEVGRMMSEGKVIGRMCKIKLWDKNSAQERLFKIFGYPIRTTARGRLLLKVLLFPSFRRTAR